MVAFDRTDGLKQATLIIASTAGLYYIWDLVNDCKVNDAKKQKILFLLLTLFLYMNINWWFSGLKAIGDTTGKENGDFVAGTSTSGSGEKLVRNGIPGLTDNTRHEITLAFDNDVSTTALQNTADPLIASSISHHDGTDAQDHSDSSEPISEHDRNFKHFVFCIAFSAVLTGIFSVVGTK